MWRNSFQYCKLPLSFPSLLYPLIITLSPYGSPTHSKTITLPFLFFKTRSISPFLFDKILSITPTSIFSLLLSRVKRWLLLVFLGLFSYLLKSTTDFWAFIRVNIAKFSVQVFYKVVFRLWNRRFSLKFLTESLWGRKDESDVFLNCLLLSSPPISLFVAVATLWWRLGI